MQDMVFKLLQGRQPDEWESKVLKDILIQIMQDETRTTLTTSTKDAVCVGILSGNSETVEKAMRDFSNITSVSEFVAFKKETGAMMYGYSDSVDDASIQIQKNLPLSEKHTCYLGLALEIEENTGRHLNRYGLIAALLLEMGFEPKLGSAVYIIGQVPGLIAANRIEQQCCMNYTC